MKSKAQRSVFIAFVIVVSFGVGGVATAVAQGNAPRTEPVSGTFHANPTNVMFRNCLGEDGPYTELRGKWAGSITSSDPRLNGELEFMAQSALVNRATGFGTFHGTFSISDATGMQTARGEFFTIVTEGRLTDPLATNHGFANGKVVNRDGPADDFFANLKSTLNLTTLHTDGEYGMTGDPRTPAVIQGGHCTGPFTKFPSP